MTLSQVSSEEDVPIFHRSLKTPTSDDDDRYLDGSLSPSDSIFGKITDKDTATESGYTEKTRLTESNSWRISGSGPDIKVPKLTRAASAKVYENRKQSPKRPKSAKGGHIFSESTNLPPKPLENTWTGNAEESGFIKTENMNIDLATPPSTPSFEEKRQEVPELSPKGDESEEIDRKDAGISSKIQKKLQPKRILKDKENHEESKTVVSQYFSSTPDLSLEAVNLGNALVFYTCLKCFH